MPVLAVFSMLPMLSMLPIFTTLLLPLSSTTSSMPCTARRPRRRPRSLTRTLQIPPFTPGNRPNRNLHHTRIIDRAECYFAIAHLATQLDLGIFCCGNGHDEFYTTFCTAVP